MPQIPGGFELILILAVVLLLFGGKKIPQLAKGLGEGIRNFKKSIKDDEPEVAKDDTETSEPKKVEGSEEAASTAAPKETKQA
ncbi:MAG: twin-arginine translocase TatA/TatE family subunit [Helicobacteraceae bacterium]|jgi:sec-independent protein translocase protein TatA|nr:twin-arginine translocase TatA/TatE family subunit [Helicobacteraceae bacterium]